jgi:RimJ/RimL family protein N-acetyltransferase
MIYLSCTKDTFTPSKTDRVRWLQVDFDFEIAQWYWQQMQSPLTFQTWIMVHAYGYQYAVILEAEKPVACAGVWRFSDTAWEVAAVSTLLPYRKRGYARQAVSFVTAYILGANRLATCSTSDENAAMIATARSVGYQIVPQEAVWWKYPELPDF